MQVIDKKVRMKLVDVDDRSFSVLAEFVQRAKEQGWTPQESDAVVKEATSGDYDHLLRTLMAHTTRRAAVGKGRESGR